MLSVLCEPVVISNTSSLGSALNSVCVDCPLELEPNEKKVDSDWDFWVQYLSICELLMLPEVTLI